MSLRRSEGGLRSGGGLTDSSGSTLKVLCSSLLSASFKARARSLSPKGLHKAPRENRAEPSLGCARCSLELCCTYALGRGFSAGITIKESGVEFIDLRTQPPLPRSPLTVLVEHMRETRREKLTSIRTFSESLGCGKGRPCRGGLKTERAIQICERLRSTVEGVSDAQ